MKGSLFQISSSPGGVPKSGRHDAEVGPEGLRGDGHKASIHGGPEKAVCLYSLERILALQQEGHPVFPGSTGENMTLSGFDWDRLVPGIRLQVGSELHLEISSFTKPCRKIEGSFRNGDIDRMDQLKHPGWSRLYARVLQPGSVRVGDPVVAQEP